VKRDPALVRLSRDHNRGLVVALHVEHALPEASGAEVDEMLHTVVDFWRTSLLPHFRAECECLLARLVRHAGLSDALITRTETDHLQVHALVASLREANNPAERRRLLSNLATLLRDHIRWEESVLFEATQTSLTPPELAALAEDLAERIPEEPPPPPWPR
jgi:hemerythrin-like domain-containing protein